MFEIGQGKELTEEEFYPIARIIFLMFLTGLFLILSVRAETVEQSYSMTIKVDINTGNNLVYIYMEGDNRTFSITNSTNSYSINFRRNASCSESSASNLSNSITALTSTCSSITEAYKDASSFYRPLLECTTFKAQCEKDKELITKEKENLKGVESNYNTCISEKKGFETQFTTCNNEYKGIKENKDKLEKENSKIKSDKSLYGWGLVIAVLISVGYYYKEKKKEKEHPLEEMPPQQ